jgi:hypothetical protein
VPIIAVVDVCSSAASSLTFSVFFALEIAIAFAPLPKRSEKRDERSVVRPHPLSFV